MTKESEIIWEELESDIVTRKYLPGCKLAETEIAGKYHLSRTPIRDIFKALEQDGLLEVRSQSGSFVTPINLRDRDDRRFIRASIELQILTAVRGKMTASDFLYLDADLEKRKHRSFEKGKGDKLTFANSYFDLDNHFHAFLYAKAKKSSVLKWLNTKHPTFRRYRFLTFLRDNPELESFYLNHKAIYDVLKDKDRSKLREVVAKHNYSGRIGLDKVKKDRPELFVR